jgi:hypothetical protein
MQIALEQSGAMRGLLILARGNEYRIELRPSFAKDFGELSRAASKGKLSLTKDLGELSRAAPESKSLAIVSGSLSISGGR